MSATKDAIEAAYAERVGRLFTVLCENLTDAGAGRPLGEPEPIDRFLAGLKIARRAREEALQRADTADGAA